MATYEGSASPSLKLAISGLGAAATFTSIADAAEQGNLQGALLSGLGLLIGSIASAVQQAAADPGAETKVRRAMADLQQSAGGLGGAAPSSYQLAANTRGAASDAWPMLSMPGAAAAGVITAGGGLSVAGAGSGGLAASIGNVALDVLGGVAADVGAAAMLPLTALGVIFWQNSVVVSIGDLTSMEGFGTGAVGGGFTPTAPVLPQEGFWIDPDALTGMILSTPANTPSVMQTTGSPAEPQVNLGAEGFSINDSNLPLSFEARMSGPRLPVSNGSWSGVPGNSDWTSIDSGINAATGGLPIPYKNGFPDFSQWPEGSFKVDGMTETNSDFGLIYDAVAKQYGFSGRAEAKEFLLDSGLTPHHVEDGQTIQLVPSDLNNRLPHSGGASILRNEG